jgi:hypothetical protein
LIIGLIAGKGLKVHRLFDLWWCESEAWIGRLTGRGGEEVAVRAGMIDERWN